MRLLISGLTIRPGLVYRSVLLAPLLIILPKDVLKFVLLASYSMVTRPPINAC